MKEIWDKKFSSDEFIYGKEPNNFFKSEIEKLSPGRLISLGEGEGRNIVYAAKIGWITDAIDFSESAKQKAELLACENNVQINYSVTDFKDFVPKENYYDLVTIIFFHLPNELKQKMFGDTITLLKPGGKVIMEVFEKEQLKYNSGGPKSEELLYSLEEIVEGLIQLEFIKFSKEIIELREGNHHSGNAAVIRFVGEKV